MGSGYLVWQYVGSLKSGEKNSNCPKYHFSNSIQFFPICSPDCSNMSLHEICFINHPPGDQEQDFWRHLQLCKYYII